MKADASKDIQNVIDQSQKEKTFEPCLEDNDGWRRFLKRSIPMLYGMYVRKGLNPALAEELVQKTVFDAVKGHSTFDKTKGSTEQWIFGIARRNIAIEMRRRASRPTVNGDITAYLNAIDTRPLPDEILERTETAQAVKDALEKLDARDRTVLQAKYIQDLSARTIAEKIGVTEKAVHSLLYRARKSLRDKLKNIRPLNKEEQKK